MTIQVTSALWSKSHLRSKAKGKVKVKETTINRSAKERSHVTVAAHMDTKDAKGKGESQDQKSKNLKDQKGKGNQAGSVDDGRQTQEPEAETGPLELIVFDAP